MSKNTSPHPEHLGPSEMIDLGATSSDTTDVHFLSDIQVEFDESNRTSAAEDCSTRDANVTQPEMANVSAKKVGLFSVPGHKIQVSKDFGVGLDVHSRFLQICVSVRQNGDWYEYQKEFPTDWASVTEARQWVVWILSNKSDPPLNSIEPLHYCMESTASYHAVVQRNWLGNPSIINPVHAGSVIKKTDVVDAHRLCLMDLTGIWKPSYVISDDVAALRVLIAERNNYGMLATRGSNRINSTLLRFGITVGREGSVTRNAHVRDIVMNLISDHPTPDEKICPTELPVSVKAMIRQEYEIYDENRRMHDEYERLMIDKVKSMEWKTGDKFTSGDEILKLLTTVPGIGMINAVIWLAFIVTTDRFETAKMCSAYCGLDPSVQISAKHVTSRQVRKGNKVLHASLVQAGSIVMKNASEMFGQFGKRLYLQTGSWRKATNAVARKIAVALYYVQGRGEKFSYEKYKMFQQSILLDIPIEELVTLMPDFRRYLKILKENGISTTRELVRSYEICAFAKIKGLGKKFYSLVNELASNQKRYADQYAALHNNP